LGRFESRAALMSVAGLGPRAFEQCAGFLRVLGGTNPLDASAVHPESYPVVEALLQKLGKPLDAVMGQSSVIKALQTEHANDASFTLKDVLRELEKPGRDPRPSFKVAQLAEGVERISDLREGMILEGTVSNVAAFGAFVDLGVHQDGLVHVSQMADGFVKDARERVKTGDIIKVRVLEVDPDRKRIGLSMRLQDRPQQRLREAEAKPKQAHREQKQPTQHKLANSAMAEAFAKLKSR
jgi:protein Tex